MSDLVQVVEVGPRDGLQNEKNILPLATRLEFIHHLAASGLRRIEVGAFVSPQWVPQMNDSQSLINELYKNRSSFPKLVRFSALVPNLKGMHDALTTPIREVAVFGASSESFSRRNINCSIAESLTRFQDICSIARSKKIKVRGYLSVAFGCPFEGKVSEKKVINLIKSYLAMGIHEVSIGDTIGVATPKQVRSLLGKLKEEVGLSPIAMHMHDTRGTALANVLASLDLGVRVFDSSFGGLGGCPYARGASGNLATDDLVYMLHGMGLKTGINLARMLEFGPRMTKEIGRKLPSRTSEAGLPQVRPFTERDAK